jgi:hypothetical protein
MSTVPSIQILLHLLKLSLLLPLLGVQLVDLGFEAPPVLPKPLIIHPFLF